MRRPFLASRLAFPVAALLALAVLAAPAAAQVSVPIEEGALTSFVPRPSAVVLQQTGAVPELGNTLVVLVLDADEHKRLNEETGRTDLLVVGPAGQLVTFRDDGKEGDEKAGDLKFTGVADIDLDELAARAEAGRTAETAGETQNVPVFDGRTLVGETTVQPFDFDAFEAGEPVSLERGLSISSQPAAAETHEAEAALGNVTAATHVPGTNQFQDRVLMIRDPLVVTDPTRTFDACTGAGTPLGPWTFGHLMTAMANQPATGINPSTFVETWLNHWLANQTINSFNVPLRTKMQALINDWRAASGGGALDLKIAPFRLLAINPRIDLRRTTGSSGGYGSTASGAFLDAGEARFTFGVVLPQSYTQARSQFFNTMPIPNSNNCLATPFSVITEFRVPKCKCEDVRAWAKQWIQLNGMTPGSSVYNKSLEQLTRTFTDAGRNPSRANGSAIGQVRSNEIAITPGPPPFLWEIREFQLRMAPWSFLLETTTADSPDDSFNNTNTFGNFVLDTISGAAGPPVPLFYPLGSTQNFLGAHPLSPNLNTFWNAPNLNVANPPEDAARHAVSLGTCNGCHNRETNTIFVHIDPNTPGLPATLSGFLTGNQVNDPAGSGTVRHFDDLARRETDINAVANMICGSFQPIRVSAVAIGPLRSNGSQLQSISAANGVSSEPDGAPLSIAVEDFLRQPIRQVH